MRLKRKNIHTINNFLFIEHWVENPLGYVALKSPTTTINLGWRGKTDWIFQAYKKNIDYAYIMLFMNSEYANILCSMLTFRKH